MSSLGLEEYKKFLSLSITEQYRELCEQPATFWEEIGAKKALEVFHEAAERVPAYKHFLHEHNIAHKEVKTLADFAQVPPVTKYNYLRNYPLHELCWDGTLANSNVISVSSGSTGKPFMWPRDVNQEKEVDHIYNLTLEYLFECNERPSLVLICFALGMYIAGPFTYASCLRYAEGGKPLTITCPSNNIEAALRIIEELSPEFEQIIIGGYPPLVKDLLDAAARQELPLKDKSVRLFFGGESFSEQWRDYVHNLVGSTDVLKTSVNMYGTADAALLGLETPTSIAFRRLAANDMGFRRSHLLSERLPSILSYNPLLKYFEVDKDESLLFTSGSGIPLIRYEIGDHGGVIPHHQVELAMQESATTIEEQLEKGGASHLNWKLPLVYLFGRKDFTTHLYGANVYPENIKEALESPHLNAKVTGKFILTTEHRTDMTPYLFLRVQLAPHVEHSAELREQVQRVVTSYLKEHNSEYLVIYNTIQDGAIPEIQLDAHGNEDYTLNIKHRWVKK